MTLPYVNETLPEEALTNNETFILSFPNGSTVGQSEANLMTIGNPSTSGKSMTLFYKRLACTNGTDTVTFKIYANPIGVSAGTGATAVNLRIGSGQSSISNNLAGPSTSGHGTYIGSLSSSFGIEQISTISEKLDPGNTLLVTAISTGTSTGIIGSFVWWES